MLVEEAGAIIQREYWDTTFHGQDWQRIRSEVPQGSVRTKREAYTAIRAMLAKLDAPATRLLEPAQYAEFERELFGKTTLGIGLLELLSIDIDEHTRELTVVTPVPGSPAAAAGLMPRDVIEAIDGRPTKGLWLEEAMARLRGEPGTKVTLTVRRQDQRREVMLVREQLSERTRRVRGHVDRVQGLAVAYIALEDFGPDTDTETRKAVKAAVDAHADGLVLDLRNNPGGSVDMCLEVAGLFLGEEPLASVRGRPGRAMTLVASNPQLYKGPMAVLVNEGTASAAELLAAALQDHRRATLVGARTFGKGLVHIPFPLSDGSVLLVSVGRLVTLEDRDILDRAVEVGEQVAWTGPRESAGGPGDAPYLRAVELLRSGAKPATSSAARQ